MADAAVEFLLNNLKELLVYHGNVIKDTKENVEDLQADLHLLNAFMKESIKRRKTHEPTMVLVQNIRSVVYDVEDVIDAFVTKVLEKKSKSGGFLHFITFWNPLVDLHSIGLKVIEVRNKVVKARDEFVNLRIHDDVSAETLDQIRSPRHKDVVGFTDVIKRLKGFLLRETETFDIVSLIGMFGLGKTTLAWKLFHDAELMYEFRIRIWLPISQEFSQKDIFVNILKAIFTTVPDNIKDKTVDELAKMVSTELEEKTFLIVMDDVWTRADWDKLRIALPDNKNGKVMITSRHMDVGKYASTTGLIEALRLFGDDESWELLQLEALHHKEKVDPDLEKVGEKIAKNCKGIPLAVVVIGGILATMSPPDDLSATIRNWEIVSTKVATYLKEDPEDRMNKFISLSYDKIPLHLRACFLYFGMFPEDYEIPASKLIRMWMGEGFIQQNDDRSLEETARKYLDELINRNLVRSEKFKTDGNVKTCKIHDALRDFCRTEAGKEKENFLREIREKEEGGFTVQKNELPTCRRLCIHSNCLKFIESKPFGPRVRSFVCFAKDDFMLPDDKISEFLEAFKLMRVFDVKPIKFTKINSDMYKLFHLRYIVLSLDLPTLPKKFGQLWNTQTLIIETSHHTLDIKADIWGMNQLRHFKTNASAVLPPPTKESKSVSELQTLGTISVESCTAEILKQACNLKKLGIRGRLASLLEGKVGSIDSLGTMKYLEKLKLINDWNPKPPSELQRLPKLYQFPSKLRSLTLVATMLKWEHMSTLGLLERLEMLKLKNKAFMGSKWKAVDGGFRKLELLHIEETDLEDWEASFHHFPRLKGLVLKNCDKFRAIPIELAQITSLKMLDVNNSKSANASAMKIDEVKKTKPAEAAVFKLSIYPPINN